MSFLTKKQAAEIGIQVLENFERDAIEKAAPRAVKGISIDRFSECYDSPRCPRCGEWLFTSTNGKYMADSVYAEYAYCPYCGQSIAWPNVILAYRNDDSDFTWEEFKDWYFTFEEDTE